MRNIHRAVPYVLGTVALAGPCLWLPGIYHGDLSSHVYNAWLAQLIRNGHGQGLTIEPQFTNVLFDWLLQWLLPFAGLINAGRLALTMSVLVFGWGAFAFTCAVSQARPWRILPTLTMLAHGWVLQMGLLNFYLSLGLCFFAMALGWRPTRYRIAGAAVLFCVAWTAHALPVVWSIGMLAYLWVARNLSSRARFALAGGAIAFLVLLKIGLALRFETQWFPTQLLSATGVDQFWVFGNTFSVIALGMLVFWAMPVVRFVRSSQNRNLAANFPLQISILTGLAVALIPGWVLLPGYKHALTYIADRMSLAVAVCGCALLATLPWRRIEQAGMTVLIAVFFILLYADQRAISNAENRIELALKQLPAGGRVVSAFNDPPSRINAFMHLLDQACIGHCFSYGNYEPSTAAFRVRANGPNPVVVFRSGDPGSLENGGYIVEGRDLPLVEMIAKERGLRFELNELQQGESTHRSTLHLPF